MRVSGSAEAVKRTFALDDVPQLDPRYNIAPTQDVAAIRAGEEGTRSFVMLHWGLVPKWAKERAIGNRMINARAESLADKPAFRNALRKRRCVILASGFYEWKKQGGGKAPYYITPADGRPMAFAGLWERWDKGEGPLDTCTIITTDANALVAPIHDRMPVILPPEAFEAWLDPHGHDAAALSRWLLPAPPESLTARIVSRAVNDARSEGPELIAPA